MFISILFFSFTVYGKDGCIWKVMRNGKLYHVDDNGNTHELNMHEAPDRKYVEELFARNSPLAEERLDTVGKENYFFNFYFETHFKIINKGSKN